MPAFYNVRNKRNTPLTLNAVNGESIQVPPHALMKVEARFIDFQPPNDQDAEVTNYTVIVTPSPPPSTTHPLSGTLDGTELVGVFQNGLNVFASINSILTLAAAGGARIQTTTGLAIGVLAGNAKNSSGAGSDDVFIGFNTGISVPAGQTFHTFIGAYAGAACTAGSGSVAIGQKSLITPTTIASTVAVGPKIGNALSSANADVFVGYGAAQFSNSTNLGRRIFIGYAAGNYDNGDCNVGIGYGAGPQTTNNNATTSSKNTYVGAYTFGSYGSNTATGERNAIFGYETGFQLTSGALNALFGAQAGYAITTGSSNTLIGAQTGGTLTTGQYNVCLGHTSGGNLPSNALGYFVCGSDSSGGTAAVTNVYFGTGYQAATPQDYTIHGCGALNADTNGANLILAGGIGKGAGLGGSVKVKIAPHGGAGSTANALIDALVIDGESGLASFVNGVKTKTGTLAQLGTASAAGMGTRMYCTDLTAVTFMSTAAGGGSLKGPVVSDGTIWQVG